MNLAEFSSLVGFSRHEISHREIPLSALGGFLGILGIFLVSRWLLGEEFAVLIVPSMGATAVLLFAAPHAPFSQPWNVIGGHAISALIGVACWQWIPDQVFAASASVGLAIGAMYVARCIHPPGGATALVAVIGTEELHQLGYSYEFTPILLNAVTILLVAILFNGLFRWRAYPAHVHRKRSAVEVLPGGYEPIRHEDFVYALSQIDTLVDISEAELLEIYRLATRRHVAQDNVGSDEI